jgi:hypothetical protein
MERKLINLDAKHCDAVLKADDFNFKKVVSDSIISNFDLLSNEKNTQNGSIKDSVSLEVIVPIIPVKNTEHPKVELGPSKDFVKKLKCDQSNFVEFIDKHPDEPIVEEQERPEWVDWIVLGAVIVLLGILIVPSLSITITWASIFSFLVILEAVGSLIAIGLFIYAIAKFFEAIFMI